jgi:hypothetical protein
MFYTISRDEHGFERITCRLCRKTSYHPEDVKHRFCADCNMFLDVMAQRTVQHFPDDCTYCQTSKLDAVG